MTEISEEARKVIGEEVAKELGKVRAEIIDEVIAKASQSAAPAHQDDCPGCKQRDGEIGELKGRVQSWEKGEQFLAFDPTLHAVHPNSKPKVDEYVQGALKALPDDELKTEIIGRGFLPPVKEITLPNGRKIKPKD